MKLGIEPLQCAMEARWYAGSRPYYNLYPFVIDRFCELDISRLPSSVIDAPEPFAIRLPEDQRKIVTADGTPVRSIMLYALQIRPCEDFPLPAGQAHAGLGVWYDVGETDPDLGHCVWSWNNIRLLPDRPLVEGIAGMNADSFYRGVQIGEDCQTMVVNLAISVLLLDRDESIIEPDVLARDAQAYARALDAGDADRIDQLQRRAMQRGKHGWVIGRAMEPRRGEVAPHWRNGCFATYHYGPKKAKSKVRWRRGSPVNLHKAAQVPTGRVDADEAAAAAEDAQ